MLSVAHVAVVQPHRLSARFPDRTRLMPVNARVRLPFDHPSIVKRAVEHLRGRYATTPDPDRLLDETFTMRQLLMAHQAVAGRELQRDWFRRTMEPQLDPTGKMSGGGRGRPAELFRHQPD